MFNSLLPYFIPFGVSLAVAGVLRLLAGPETGSRLAGLGVLIGFVVAWQWLLLAPWFPYDTLDRVIHIAIGGMIFGLILDFLVINRSWTLAAIFAYAIGSVWAAITGALVGPPPDDAGGWLRAGLYVVIWLAFIQRLTKLRVEGPSAVVILFLLALGAGLVGQMSGLGSAAATAYCMAAALFGYLVLAWILALPVGNLAILVGAGGVMGIIMSLAEPESGVSLIAIAFLGFVPFADGTARRLPLGGYAIKPILYPLALMAIGILPLLVATILAYVLVG